MTDEERTKARNAERLDGDESMMTYMLFLAAAMAGGATSMANASKYAGQAMDHLRQKFT